MAVLDTYRAATATKPLHDRHRRRANDDDVLPEPRLERRPVSGPLRLVQRVGHHFENHDVVARDVARELRVAASAPSLRGTHQPAGFLCFLGYVYG